MDIVSPDTNPPAGKQKVLGCRGPQVMRGFSGHQGALGTPARGQVTKGHLGHQGELKTQGGAQDPPWALRSPAVAQVSHVVRGGGLSLKTPEGAQDYTA